MKQVVNHQKLKFVASTEKSPSSFSNIATLEFIYGKPDGSELEKWSKDLSEFETLLSWTAEDWSGIIDKYLVQNKSATILGKPSAKLNELMQEQNKKSTKILKPNMEKMG